MFKTTSFSGLLIPWFTRLPGLVLAAVMAGLCSQLANLPTLARWGLSTLTLSILLGMVVGNTALTRLPSWAEPGIDLARTQLLRLGIVLFGFRISVADVTAVGASGILLAAGVVVCTFALAYILGTRWLGLDRDTTILIGAGSSICGAAAVMGAQSVVQGSERSTSVAIATVVLFGTLSMLIYPVLYPWSGLSPEQFGVYTGATVHEVAQVVAVGSALGVDAAANTAVIEKMLRVVFLAPFLLFLALGIQRARTKITDSDKHPRIQVPWFAVWFLVAVALHSSGWLPTTVIHALVTLANLLLATAMLAIGLRTSARSLRAAGWQPLKLAACLFFFLMGGGWLAVRWLPT